MVSNKKACVPQTNYCVVAYPGRATNPRQDLSRPEAKPAVCGYIPTLSYQDSSVKKEEGGNKKRLHKMQSRKACLTMLQTIEAGEEPTRIHGDPSAR